MRLRQNGPPFAPYKENISGNARMQARLNKNGTGIVPGSFGGITGARVSEVTALWLNVLVALAICIDPAPLIVQDHSGARPAAVDAGATLMKIFPLVLVLGIALTGTAFAEQRLAVADFDFLDTSGEVRPQEEEHTARMALFLKTLRGEIDRSDIFEVVQPDCADGCSPARTSLEHMASATERVDATLLLVGRIHKISTLIGKINIYVIDLKGDQVVCERFLSYRGDDDQAWSRAATSAATDVIRYCRP